MDFGKLELHYLSCFEPILQQKNLSFLYLFISTSRLVVCKTWFYLLLETICDVLRSYYKFEFWRCGDAI